MTVLSLCQRLPGPARARRRILARAVRSLVCGGNAADGCAGEVGRVRGGGTMIVEISRSYEFQAAHFLPMVPPEHKCSRMHGHTYTATIVLRGTVDASDFSDAVGWLCDFGRIDAFWSQTCHPLLDHQTLNDVIRNPTSELVALWIWRRGLLALHPLLHSVTVSENGRSSATVFA